MLKAGLTGNMGSGKSVVASVFSSLGVPVYHADEESKKFLEVPEIIDSLVSLFGRQILNNKLIDKRMLALTVFANKNSLEQLNALLHPLVMKDFNSRISSAPPVPYVIMEAAILFESGYSKDFDSIIHVSCPEEIAIARVIARDRIGRDQVLARMGHQIKNDDKARLSDFVIINDGSRMLIPQVISIHKKLMRDSL
jgi:dephospho-CoA kinase